jgi:hypothetical protein
VTAIKAKNGKTIVQNVQDILDAFPEARNNDRILFAYYWAAIDEVEFEEGYESFVESYKNATPPSSIQRARQMINYEAPDKNYLPTDPRILKMRQEKSNIMSDKYGRMKMLGGF